MFPVFVGLLTFCGLIFLLRGQLLSLVIGIILLGNAANLLIFSISDPPLSAHPFLNADGLAKGTVADPIPQALVLTAIVISFAILCYMIAIIKKIAGEYGLADSSELPTEDLDE